MSSNINFRVFRRNNKNLILLWNNGTLPDTCRETVSAFIDREEGGPLKFSRFVPESPDKFAKDVDGIVIPHSGNDMDPSKGYEIHVVFGEGDDAMEVIKLVKPANFSHEVPTSTPDNAVHIYGMDYSTGKWVPFPVDPKLLDGFGREDG